MDYNLQIQKILLQVDKTVNPEDKMNLLKEAIKIADANNDIDWGFDLRLDLIREETYTSHCTESFPAFAWILNVNDNNPEMFDESDFLWEYKWMASSARRNVNISREQIENIMEDLKVRMSRNGYTDRAYHTVMLYWHLFIGNIEKAREHLKLRDEASRDRMSHCPACELDASVELELIDGNFDKAISKAHDLITKKLTCGRMPFGTFCNLTYYLGKANDPRANEYFVKAEEELATMENDMSLIGDISLLMHYLNKNNREKAWEYFEKYADWEVDAEDALSFDFSATVLPLLKEGGEKTLNMSSKLPYYNSDNKYNVTDLYNYYEEKAKKLAQQFDLRNGNDHFSERLQQAELY
ncbi:MAG: hypothetical protein ACLVKO_01405 [Dysgonomonas sp.]